MDREKLSTSQYLVFSTYTNSSAQTLLLDDRPWDLATLVERFAGTSTGILDKPLNDSEKGTTSAV